jgi:CRISPR-associated protein Cmr2
LIYAGGDDVLALLPAQNAIECAKALRLAFQGKSPGVAGIESPRDGFLSVDGVPFAVPGPRADVSVGIAVAHFKHPLQDVVRAAQKAEKNAKSRLAACRTFTATKMGVSGLISHGC